MTGPLSGQQIDEIRRRDILKGRGASATTMTQAQTDRRALLRLLDDVAGYLAATHRHASRHDVLGVDLGCAGCALLARIEGTQPAERQPVAGPAGEGSAA